MRIVPASSRAPLSGRMLLRSLLVSAFLATGSLAAFAQNGDEPSATEKSWTERFLFGGKRLPEQKEAAQEREYGCPEVTILDGTGSIRVGGGSGAARGIAYQAAINDYARECRPTGATMNIKVGVTGRLILGDSGKPGSYSVPVRVAVRSNGKIIYSKLLPTGVTVPPNDTLADFTVIDDAISVPITAEDPGEAYTILIGLDPKGGGAAPRKKKRR